MGHFRYFRLTGYILKETLPAFIMGLAVFLFIIIMFQILRLTEFALIHGVDFKTLGEVISYVCISLVPAILPMSLLFSVLITYIRLSGDSEILAMKAIGTPSYVLLIAPLIFGIGVGLFSAKTSFEIGPWGNRQFEVLFTRLGNMKASVSIKAGTFSEGFFDRVVYAEEVDNDKGILKKVFIYDEKSSDSPLTIIAKTGQLIPDPDLPGHRALMRLTDGEIHRNAKTHTKIKFGTYDLRLNEDLQFEKKAKSPPSLTLKDIDELLQQPQLKKEDEILYKTEYHKRWAAAFLCPVFALLGCTIGTNTNRRAQRTSAMLVCFLIIVGFWIFYITCESVARAGYVPPWIALWLPNLFFSSLAARIFWKKN